MFRTAALQHFDMLNVTPTLQAIHHLSHIAGKTPTMA
jgi:hypothetical protein